VGFYTFVFAKYSENQNDFSGTTVMFLKNVRTEQWFPTGEEFLPWEEFHEFRGGISTF